MTKQATALHHRLFGPFLTHKGRIPVTQKMSAQLTVSTVHCKRD